jgi:dTDP-glucose pyrophosphorylase
MVDLLEPKIILPALGESNRFRSEGYFLHKMFLPLNIGWKTLLIDEIVSTFIKSELQIVIGANSIVSKILEDWAYLRGHGRQIKILTIDEKTEGQAHTVQHMLSKLRYAQTTPLVIHNIDTILRYEFPTEKTKNLLHTVKLPGDHWSFVLPDQQTSKVIRVTEKERISDYCCNGLYCFESKEVFEYSFVKAYTNFNPSIHKEMFIAPMYNVMIDAGIEVNYRNYESNHVVSVGTPDEYQSMFEGGLYD